ncbi:MAG: hypothetical protein J4F36_12765 [Nitrosopumilaceae archaeon]|nr:hypothetical protein [Nitrosopumilaceae archaeon]
MIKKLFLLVGFLLIITNFTSINAEEINFNFLDGFERTVFYELTNATMIETTLTPPNIIKFEVEGVDGILDVSIPKTVPIQQHEIHPVLILLNNKEMSNETNDDTDCFFNYSIPISRNTELEFAFAYWPETPIPVYYLKLGEDCNISQEKSVLQIQTTICSNDKLIKFMNIRDEVVCLSISSIHKLMEREYLIPTNTYVVE